MIGSDQYILGNYQCILPFLSSMTWVWVKFQGILKENQQAFTSQVGPPVGGFLYSAGGFFLPFVVMGALNLLMGVFIYIALPSNTTNKRSRLFSLYAYVEHVS